MKVSPPSPEDMLLAILYYARENCGLASIPDDLALLENVLADYAISHEPVLSMFNFETEGAFVRSKPLEEALITLFSRNAIERVRDRVRLVGGSEEDAKKAGVACCPFCVWEVALHVSKCLKEDSKGKR